MGTLYVRHGLHSIPFEEWFRLQYEQPEPKPEPVSVPEPDPFHFACRYCGSLDDTDACCSAAWHASEGDNI